MKLALGTTLYAPGDPMGKMLFNVLATFAEFEGDLIRLRTREGMAMVAALRGEAEALQRQNQSLMAALSGNKQSGDQNA